MPQTVFDVGDTITTRLKLGVTPDGTTAVTVAVTKPDGTAQTLSGGPTGPTNVDEWTAQWVANHAGGGDYLAVWTVTGTGAGVQAKVFPVRGLPGAGTRPTWTPFLSDVADHTPWLTVDTTSTSATHLGTFTGSTWPPDDAAQRITDQAVTSVAAALGTVNTGLYDMAGLVASLRAAAAIVRAYPRDPSDLNTADALDRRADAELARLIAANANAGESAVPAALLPLYAFPDAPAWADLNL